MAGNRIAALAGKHRRAPEATGGGEAATGRLFRTAGVLMLNTGLTAALGFGFWILAARLYSPQEVGVNSAIIAILVTVSTLAQVNLGSVFVRFLPETARPARLILVGYAVAAG
jgi:O-antigen/teichoic acid export membrane protein